MSKTTRLKDLYLFAGDDAAKLDAARDRLRKRVCSGDGAGSMEVWERDRCTVEAVSQSIAALALTAGKRVVLADGVEKWRANELDVFEVSLRSIAPETTLVMIGRGKVSSKLIKLVERNKGEVRKFSSPKPWLMPQWVRERAKELELELDAEGAETLVARVGVNQQRLMRELEKIATAMAGAPAGRGDVEDLASESTNARIFDLVDAFFDGQSARALDYAEELRGQGEDGLRILNLLVRQLRVLLAASALLESGHSATEVQAALSLSPYAAKHVFARARKAQPDLLRKTLTEFAEVDYQLKGGGAIDPELALTFTLGKAVL